MRTSKKATNLTSIGRSFTEETTIIDHDRYYSRAVGKAFELIEILNRAGKSLSLRELSARVELTKSYTFRLLHTLQLLQYVTQDSENRYLLATENWVSQSVEVRNALVVVAREPAQALRTRLQETVSLAVLYANHIEVVQGFESPRVIRMANTMGGIIPPHASSLGKSITAFQPEPVQSRLIHSYGIRRFTEFTITDELDLMKELDQVRKQGFAYERGEAFVEGCCIGCPIFAGGENAVAAISTSMPRFRLPEGKDQERLISDLCSTARTISEELTKKLRTK